MKRILAVSLLLMFSTGCISLFSEIEIHESGNQHHVNAVHDEALEQRLNELEEKLHYLLKRLEERKENSDFKNRDKGPERDREKAEDRRRERERD